MKAGPGPESRYSSPKQGPHPQRVWSRRLMFECLESFLYIVPCKPSVRFHTLFLYFLKNKELFSNFICILDNFVQTFVKEKVILFETLHRFQVINQVFFAD